MYVAGSLSKLLQTNSLGIMSPTLMAPSPCFTGTFCEFEIGSRVSFRLAQAQARISFEGDRKRPTAELLSGTRLLLLHHDDLPLVQQPPLNALQAPLAPADELSVQPHV